jgi:hypothetical protein
MRNLGGDGYQRALASPFPIDVLLNATHEIKVSNLRTGRDSLRFVIRREDSCTGEAVNWDMVALAQSIIRARLFSCI